MEPASVTLSPALGLMAILPRGAWHAMCRSGSGKPATGAQSATVLDYVAAAGNKVMRGMVLVVDDDEGVRAVMATALEDDGWTVTTAENGRRALEALQQAQPEAIILDLRMPVMDGLTFAQQYRDFPEPRAPLILISATVTHAAIRETGAVTGLRKPVDLDVLLDAVREHAAESD
jgi:two-component system, chemotaxis family, chemotaxis protein CheY